MDRHGPTAVFKSVSKLSTDKITGGVLLNQKVTPPGTARADWMIGHSRNLCLYPNVYLMDQFSSQIRVLRPISVDKTEVTIYCIAPKGESAE